MKSNLSVLCAVFGIGFAVEAVGESLCRAEVSYHWKRDKEETAVSVTLSSIEAKGKDEAEAKAKLAEVGGREKIAALEACRKEHENSAGCVARKFDLYGASLASIGFSGKKKLEEAIQRDCAATQGTCTEAKTSDPQCVVIEVAAADAGGKDKKDGKAKKK